MIPVAQTWFNLITVDTDLPGYADVVRVFGLAGEKSLRTSARHQKKNVINDVPFSLFVRLHVQVCCGTCHRVMLWRCPSSRTRWLFWPTVSSYPTRTGTPLPITMRTASSTFIPPRCCATLQAASGEIYTQALTSTHKVDQSNQGMFFIHSFSVSPSLHITIPYVLMLTPWQSHIEIKLSFYWFPPDAQ